MVKVRLINSEHKVVTEFSQPGFKEGDIDLIEYTDQFQNRSFYIFSDKTDDGIIVYKALGKVARVSYRKPS